MLSDVNPHYLYLYLSETETAALEIAAVVNAAQWLTENVERGGMTYYVFSGVLNPTQSVSRLTGDRTVFNAAIAYRPMACLSRCCCC